MWFFTRRRSYKDIVLSKRAQREALLSIDGLNQAVVHDQEAYLRATATEIVEHIKAGQWTASDVLEAYIERAILSNRVTNCLTEIIFKKAREEAKALDREFAETRKIRGPLHGVPVSFKDLFDISGYDSSIGFTSYANQPRSKDAYLVTVVRAAGGIPFVKTNVPQTMMFFECNNPLWGRTLNPHDARFSCGGSSGGEGSLLAMDGSALGWGSDIGGSLRIPAAYCGIFSFKPVQGRISTAGLTECLPGFHGVPDVVGPMARSVDDVELACRVAFGKQPHGEENVLAPVPFRDVVLAEKLRFGYYVSDDFVKASPACRRAVLKTIDALQRDGHECVEIAIPQPSKALQIFVGLTSADGYETSTSPIGHDPTQSELFLVLLSPRLYGWVRSMGAWIAKWVLRDPIYASLLISSRRKSVREYWAIMKERHDYTSLFYEEVWNKHNLDGIIAPVQALPQIPHNACRDLAPIAGATILYNVVQCPVGVVPVTRIDAKQDGLTDDWKVSLGQTGNGHGSMLLEASLYKRGGFYDPKGMDGLPVGVQVIGRSLEDEKVLGMMKVVDRSLGPRGFGPGSWTGQRDNN